MATLGFSHLYLEVSDLDRSEAFYRDVFGLDVMGRGLVNEPWPNSTLSTNTRQRVVLVQVPDAKPTRINSNNVHHAFLLHQEQYRQAQDRLRERDMLIEDPRAQFRAVGDLSMDVTDPDGHLFQVQCFTATATAILTEGVGPVACGHVDDYAVGDVRPFVKGKFFVVRHADGFIALSRWCTHRNGLVVWKQEHWCFRCPMHGVTYDRRGRNTHFWKSVPPMRTHPLTIGADGTITVDPDTVIEREAVGQDDITPVTVAAQ